MNSYNGVRIMPVLIINLPYLPITKVSYLFLFENKIQTFFTKLNQVNDFRSVMLCKIWQKYYVS